jgi:hypothetical protein
MTQVLMKSSVSISALLLIACASSGSPAGSRPANRDLVTRAEIEAMGVRNVHQIVARRRPEFVIKRNDVVTFPWVYVDGRLAGSVDTLHDMAPEIVEEIRFIGADQAKMRYGADHMAGVIEIRTSVKR